MNKLRNEYGAALVFTLMIVTLLLLFIMTLFYQITNTTKQVSTMEREIVSEQIAKMGIDYYRIYIESLIPDTISSTEEILDMEFDKNIIMDLDEEHNFTFKIVGQDPDPESPSELTIEFTSVGEAYGKEASIDSSITINIESEE